MSDFATGVYEITVMDEAAETTTKEVEVQVIDGGGGTLTPGFIENHSHLMLMGPSIGAMETSSTWEDFAIHGSRMAEMYLMQGFTTVRECRVSLRCVMPAAPTAVSDVRSTPGRSSGRASIHPAPSSVREAGMPTSGRSRIRRALQRISHA
jgi:imidazolonepropionase-like amidohydrolase